MANSEILVKGALLKSIAEIVNRGQGCAGTLANAAQSFFSKINDRTDISKKLLPMLSQSGENVSKKDAAYILRITEKLMDIVWSDFDVPQQPQQNRPQNGPKNKTKNKGKSNAVKNNSVAVKKLEDFTSLENIFNAFGVDNSIKTAYSINGKETFSYPDSVVGRATKLDYENVLKVMLKRFSGTNIQKISCSELLDILEETTENVPSDSKKEKRPDVSLYIQTKMLAALSSSLEQYLEDTEVEDYKDFYKKRADHMNDQAFILLSGDISGIQDFIYTIPSKGALKSLRGRSFFLEIFMENFVDELLEELELTRANLLYVGGGHFYVFAGNTSKNKEIARSIQEKCNCWLLENFGSKLYMALGYSECSFNDLMHCESQRNVFANVSAKLNEDKLNRYDADTLEALFDTESIYNKHKSDSRECAICHTSTLDLIESNIADGYVCKNCEALYSLGERILAQDCAFVVSTTEPALGESGIAIFGRKEKQYLYAIPENAIKGTKKIITRVYTKNTYLRLDKPSAKLLNADYCVKENGEVKEFASLAEACCNGKSGINRLGVLRADVDNLGAAFIGGFSSAENSDANLVRYASLSHGLALFFKKAVNEICNGRLSKGQKPFSLYGESKKNRQVHVVYSGGDDVFFVGAWDDLIELAVDIRKAFGTYTNNKLTFSAGLAMFSPSFPISSMAEYTGELESCSKDVPGKDSISLFGLDTEQTSKDVELGCRHVYRWDEFENKVCREKLDFLMEYADKDFLKVGKSQLYKFMELLDGSDGKDIKLARFAYSLARLQPKDYAKNEEHRQAFDTFSSKMYSWYKNGEDRKQLYTAVNLLIYYKRESED